MRFEQGVSPRLWCEVTIVILAVFAFVGGCDWFNDPVAANLSPETWMVTCPSGDVAVGEDVLLSWGGSDPDGSVVTFAWVLDDTLTGETAETSMTIGDVTEGGHGFTVAAVDAAGETDPTPAVCAFAAAQGGFLVDRVVLAELLTTKICPNCPTAEQALDELIVEYGAADLCAIAYHWRDEQNPDPVATDESIARTQWYYDNHQGPDPDSVEDDVGHYDTVRPLVIFDGGRFVAGATTVNATKSNYRTEIEYRRAAGSPVSLVLDGDIAGGSVTATARVHDQLGAGPYTLRLVLIEDGIVVGSDHFDFVARDILDDETLTVSAAGDSAVVVRGFTVDPGWNIESMDVIGFVQDDSTLEIIQAGRLMTE